MTQRGEDREPIRALLERGSDIASQLHHGPVQQLSTLNLKLQRLQRLGDTVADSQVADLIKLTQDTMTSLHRIESWLAPTELARSGLASALANVVEFLPHSQLIVNIDGHAGDAPDEVQLIAYWIGHTTFTHAATDPDCTNADAIVRCNEAALQLELDVESQQLSKALPHEHFQRLAANIGGTCELTTNDHGVVILVELPLF